MNDSQGQSADVCFFSATPSQLREIAAVVIKAVTGKEPDRAFISIGADGFGIGKWDGHRIGLLVWTHGAGYVLAHGSFGVHRGKRWPGLTDAGSVLAAAGIVPDEVMTYEAWASRHRDGIIGDSTDDTKSNHDSHARRW